MVNRKKREKKREKKKVGIKKVSGCRAKTNFLRMRIEILRKFVFARHPDTFLHILKINKCICVCKRTSLAHYNNFQITNYKNI